MKKELKHLKTFEQNTDKNLNISDVISRLYDLNRYNFVVDYDADHATLKDKKDNRGNYVKWEDIQNILNDL
jgi:hypothetical protein